MFRGALEAVDADRPWRLFEDVEAELCAVPEMASSQFRFGAREIDGAWRCFLQIDLLPYDIIIGEPKTKGAAVGEAVDYVNGYGGVPYAPLAKA